MNVLATVKRHRDSVELLDDLCDFRFEGNAPAEWFRTVDGRKPYVFGRTAAGGEFCRVAVDDASPVIFASSEGQAGIVAANLSEFFAILVAVPFWLDVLRRSQNGDLSAMRRAFGSLWAEQVEDIDDFEERHARLVDVIGVPLLPDPLASLLAAVSSTPRVLLVAAGDGSPYAGLLGDGG